MTIFETQSGYEAIETMARALDSMSENMEKLVELAEKQGKKEDDEPSVSGSFTWADEREPARSLRADEVVRG